MTGLDALFDEAEDEERDTLPPPSSSPTAGMMMPFAPRRGDRQFADYIPRPAMEELYRSHAWARRLWHQDNGGRPLGDPSDPRPDRQPSSNPHDVVLRHVNERKKKAAEGRGASMHRVCEWCAGTYYSNLHRQKYCTTTCKAEAKRYRSGLLRDLGRQKEGA